VVVAGERATVVDEGALRMPLAGHEDIAAMASGDVIVHLGDPPVSRAIEAIRVEGDMVVVETRPAGLREALNCSRSTRRASG
jgi:hypothetical protein